MSGDATSPPSALRDAVERLLGALGVERSPLCVYATPLDDAGTGNDDSNGDSDGEIAAREEVTIEVRRASDLADISAPSFERLNPSDFVVLASTESAGVVGWTFLTVERPVTVDDRGVVVRFDGAYVWGLFVEESVRRRGVGSALVRAATCYASEGRASTAYVLVAADNDPSRRLFEHLGFALVDVVTRDRLPVLDVPLRPFGEVREFREFRETVETSGSGEDCGGGEPSCRGE